MSEIPTRYVSTKGTTETSLSDAIVNGLAPDHGLYIPIRIPRVDINGLSGESFPSLAERVLGSWIGTDIDPDIMRGICRDAFNFAVPITSLGDDEWSQTSVMELFHGPTLSFKDFGARMMARLMGHFLKQTNERVTILVATSGDTGSAVADGFSGQEGIRVILLYPNAQVSPTQERQLITEREGVEAIRVDGSFDDCQKLVKGAFADQELVDVNISSANSINIGRLLPQMLYYVWATVRAGEPLTFCVPSGNLGNLTAGVMAHLSGLPTNGFIAAHNSNRFFPDYLLSESASFRPSIETLSNAMDVGSPSNFERIVKLLDRRQVKELIRGGVVDDSVTVQSMRRVFDETGYIADPHTAVGLEAVRRLRETGGVEGSVVVLSTAHPAKFPDTVFDALGKRAETPSRLAALWDRPVKFRPMAADQHSLRAIILEEWV